MHFRNIVIFIFTVFTISTLLASKNMSDSLRKQNIEKMIQDFEKKIFVPTIEVKDIFKISRHDIKKDYIIVDVREDFEQEVSVIPGAISKKEFEKNISKYKNKKIIPYCTIGYRSAKYTEELISKKINAKNMRGSILLWMHEGGKLVDTNGKSTENVHVYGEKWDLAPKKYKSLKKQSWFNYLWGK